MSLKKFFTYVLMIVASTILTLGTLFFLFLALISAMVASVKGSMEEDNIPLKAHNVLMLRLDYPIKNKPGSPFENFDPATFKFNPPLSLPQLLTVIDEAGKDDKIDGIILNTGIIQAGFATVEELRDALRKFKAGGKFVYAFSEIYTQKSYYLATEAEKIFMHPAGIFEWRGLAAQIMFYKDLLNKLGIKMQVIRHGKFKSAVEPFVKRRMSEENRLQTRTLVFDIWNSILKTIQLDRDIDTSDLNLYADSLMVDSPEIAVKLHFFDALKYADQVEDFVRDEIGKKVNFINEREYFRKIKARNIINQLTKKEEIAVLVAEGEIVPGEGEKNQIGSARLIRRIKALRKKDKVKAVILRINSPGGSALASESIWRELKLLSQVKPLVVSMGDVAASGGYYIAVPADKIFAEENTITGSIGVFGLIPDVKDLMEKKLGIYVDTVKTNAHADMGIMRPMDAQEKQYMQKMVEQTYRIFVKRVSEGRDMTEAKVDSIGQGRVWTGKRAVSLGLVDGIKNLAQTIDYVHAEYELEDAKVTFYPALDNPFQALFDMEAEQMQKIRFLMYLFFSSRNFEMFSADTFLNRKEMLFKPRERLRMQMPYRIEFVNP